VNCNDVRERLVNLLYDELEAAERTEVKRHLDACGGCAEEIASLRGTLAALDAWDLPSGNAANARPPSRFKARLGPLQAVAVGAAAAMVVFSILTYTATRIERRDGVFSVVFGGKRPMIDDADSRLSSSEFLLLLRQGDAPASALDAHTLSERIDEYAQWSADVRAQGRDVLGQKLTQPRHLLDGGGAEVTHTVVASDADANVLGGFFRISADSFEDAVAVARTCPHLAYGGRIEVREVDPRTRN